MQIPTNPYYTIDEHAVVRLISTGEIQPEYRNHNGRRAVRIRGKSHKPRSHHLDRLMLNTFKPLPKDKNPEWMSVVFKNNDQDDLSLGNLEWSSEWYHPPVTLGVDVPRDDWVTVYEYPSVQLRLANNEVYFRDAITYREIGKKFEPRWGYFYITIPRLNVKEDVHVLVAKTLLPHPLDTYQLVVNHRDSNKQNNLPYNLEWSTISYNNFHAYDVGVRSHKVRKIRMKNLSTGDEIVVAGIQEMARQLRVLPQAAQQALDRRTFEGREYKGYVFKYEDDPRSWEQLAKSGPRKSFVRPEKIAVKHLLTGEVKIYTSFNQMLKQEEIRNFMVFRLLNNKVMVPWRYKCFQEVKDDKPLKWPDYPIEILDVYNRTHASDKPIAVRTVESVRETFYASSTEWCMEDRPNRCDPAVLTRFLEKANGEAAEWRNWIFRRIDLSVYPLV